MSIGGTAIARLALAQASPANDYAEISELIYSYNSIPGPYFGFDALGSESLGQLGRLSVQFIQDTAIAQQVSNVTVVEVSTNPLDDLGTVFGFGALGQIALGETSHVFQAHQFDVVDASVDFIVNYIVESFSNTVIDSYSYLGFAPLGQTALGQSQTTQFRPGTIFDTEIATVDWSAIVNESTQDTTLGPGSYYNFSAIGEVALGQLGQLSTTSHFIDIVAVSRTAKPANLDDLWWNNVRFQRDGHFIRPVTGTPPGISPSIGPVVRPPFESQVAIYDTMALVESNDAFVSTFSNDNSTNYVLFDSLGHLALGQLGINPLGPRGPIEASIVEQFGATQADIGPMFGFAAMGQVAIGELDSIVVSVDSVVDTLDAAVRSGAFVPVAGSELGHIIP